MRDLEIGKERLWVAEAWSRKQKNRKYLYEARNIYHQMLPF